jgi:hypothetical protein
MANENEENRLSLWFEKAIKIVVMLEKVVLQLEKCVDLNSYYFENSLNALILLEAVLNYDH